MNVSLQKNVYKIDTYTLWLSVNVYKYMSN